MCQTQWKAIRSKLNTVNPKDLISLIGDLYNLNPQNQLFLETRFVDRCEGIEAYKDIIEASICPSEPWHQDVSLRSGRKAIRDYKKALRRP